MKSKAAQLQHCLGLHIQRRGFLSVSLTTLLASLSSRSPANSECLSRSASVHSKNSICATASGRSQTHSFILSAVSSSPQRDLCVSGRLTKGIVGETR